MKLRFGVLSDTRVPTTDAGGHGLGRVAVDIAKGLARRGHTVTLYGGPGSDDVVGALVTHTSEEARAAAFDASQQDVWLDLSHHHLTRGANVLHYVMDLEAPQDVPNALVGGAYMRSRHPNGRLVPLGINVDAIPMGGGGDALAYVARLHPYKGYDIAFDVAGRSGRTLDAVGYDHVGAVIPPHVRYHGEIKSNGALFLLVGNAYALLSPSRQDAGGRINLEAAACGTPVLTLDGCGTRDHVAHGVSGWVCADADEMLDALADVPLIDRQQARDWVRYTHSFEAMLRAIEEHANAVMDGEAW